MTRHDDVQKLIYINKRRLQLLQEQKATYGISVDPKVIIEIEDIRAELETLNAILNNIDEGSAASLKNNDINKASNILQSAQFDIKKVKQRFIDKGFECHENHEDKLHQFQLIATNKNEVALITELANLDGIMDEFVVRAFVQSCWQYISSKTNYKYIFCHPCMVVNLTETQAINRLRDIASNEAEKINGPTSRIRTFINTLNPFRANTIMCPVIYSTQNPIVPLTIRNIGWMLSGEDFETTINKLVLLKNEEWLENNSVTDLDS